MPSRITRRIESDLGMPGLLKALAEELPFSDLRSLVMEVYRDRALKVRESEILKQAGGDPLLAPSTVGAREFLAFDTAAYHAAQEFEAVDLSPVCPFGAAIALGGTSQNNVLTAIRKAEMLGDPTVAMTIEAARRRNSGVLIRLCASHRVIRLQPFDVPGFSPHFRLFALVTAGRGTGSYEFEMEHLFAHARVYLQLMRALNQAGLALDRPMVEFTDMTAVETAVAGAGLSRDDVRKAVRAHKLGGSARFLQDRGIHLPEDASHPLLESRVISPLRTEFPEALFRVNHARLEGLGYYQRFALRISPQAPDGNRYPVVDGGFTDWTSRLLGNRKERLIISGIGSEFVCKKYAVRQENGRNRPR